MKNDSRVVPFSLYFAVGTTYDSRAAVVPHIYLGGPTQNWGSMDANIIRDINSEFAGQPPGINRTIFGFLSMMKVRDAHPLIWKYDDERFL